MSIDALQAGAAAPAQVLVPCSHCGLEVPRGLVDESRERQFCCTGCETAFGILHTHGLAAYYGFAERREGPVRGSGR
ncbi:MAG: heavy metal translocating P-type ATPase metal-binding domain-containing protein, partial [Gemmatimonadaceae bacterium]|nr:heavy metal translocating P-type ATPase metal-binding domain-containing protein [Gemmatimonadaceae bacterium]